MKYLIIDTSTNKASIGLADREKILLKHTWDSRKNLSETLLVEIGKLLSGSEVDGIITYLGPGSYTGLRVGISVANAFAYSLNIPIVGIKGESFGDEKFELNEMKPQDLNELLHKGLRELEKGTSVGYLTPFYGKEPNTGGK